MSSVGYDPKLHDQDARGSLESARIFLGFLFQFWKPHSVVDFGCGFGTWLLACKEQVLSVCSAWTGFGFQRRKSWTAPLNFNIRI
jgi:hypothetical protein